MSQIFKNAQVDTEFLPKLDKVEFKSITRRYLRLLLIQKSLIVVILLSVWFLIYNVVSDIDVMAILNTVFPSIIFLGLLSILHTILGFKKRRYAVRERDIIYAKGLLNHTITLVPYNRIQHIELNQSFLAKKFDVATLNIYTAGETGSDLTISGLRTIEAENINGFLSTKINDVN